MFQEQEYWKLSRLGKFTASDLHKLMQKGRGKDEYFGKGALTYIKEKLAEILTGQPIRDITGLNALEWGNAHEFEAVQLFQEIYKIEELNYYGGANPKYFSYNKYSGGSPDGLTDSHVLEVKCPYNSGIHIDNLLGSKSIDPIQWLIENRYDYFIQIQFNMMCCNKEKGYFISFDQRMTEEHNRLSVIEISFMTDLATEIKERLHKGTEKIKESLALLDKNPSILLAEHDPELNATIIEPIFNPSLLKKYKLCQK